MRKSGKEWERVGRSVVEGRRSSPDNVVPLKVPGPPPPTDPSNPSAEDESLEALQHALDGLRREIRTRLPEQPSRHDEVDWIALFDALRGRVSKLGMTDRTVETDEFGMDEQALARVRPLLDTLMDRYWRIDVSGVEHLPVAGPCLLVANHSGLLPYDGLMLAHALERLGAGCGRPRFMVADWLIALPFVQPYLARLGGVRACRENSDRLLRTGRSVIAFPEGAKGAAKSFRERYRLKRFGQDGVVRSALELGVPLVPVGIVGAEEAHPVLFKSHAPARMLGLPFIPVTPTFPLLGPAGLLPLPTKWVVTIGEPLGMTPRTSTEDEQRAISRYTEELRERVQALVESGLAKRRTIWG